MKRIACAAAVLATACALTATTTAATAATFTPKSISLSVSPKKDSTSPYKFTGKGTVKLPTASVCPKGSTNPAYCVAPPKCSSVRVAVRFTNSKTNQILSVKRQTLTSKCTYSIKTTLHDFSINRVKINVQARVIKTGTLAEKKSSVKKVTAGPDA